MTTCLSIISSPEKRRRASDMPTGRYLRMRNRLVSVANCSAERQGKGNQLPAFLIGARAQEAEEFRDVHGQGATSDRDRHHLLLASPALVVASRAKDRKATANASPLTGRAQYPNRDSRASSRADSWAGTAGRCGAGDARWAGTASASATCRIRPASCCPSPDCSRSRPRP